MMPKYTNTGPPSMARTRWLYPVVPEMHWNSGCSGQVGVEVLVQQHEPMWIGGRGDIEPGDRRGARPRGEPGHERLNGRLVEISRSHVGGAAVGKRPGCLTIEVREGLDVDTRPVDDHRVASPPRFR